MKINKTILSLLMASAIFTSGCTTAANPDINSIDNSKDANNESGTDTGSQKENASGNTGNVVAASDNKASDSGSKVSASDLFSDRDLQNGYEENGSASISLNGQSASCTSDAVKISDSKITITDEGTYILSGTLQDGMVIVDAEKNDKVQIVLNNADISSSTSAAVYVRQADKVFLTTAENTENTLSNGGAYEAIDENNIDAVIYSKDDLTLNGKGSLKILAESGHGVVSKDSLVLTGGSYDITAKNHGLSGKDDVCIADGIYKITAGKDGIHAENNDDESLGFLYISGGEFDITSEQDGISSAYFGQIEGGNFKIQAGGGAQATAIQSEQNIKDRQPVQSIKSVEDIRTVQTMQSEQNFQADESMMERKSPPEFEPAEPRTDISNTDADTVSTKGIKAGGNLWLDGGTFTIDSEDDALHTNSSIYISDGTYQITSGDDGIHADDSAEISGGKIDISQSYEGIEGKTIDISGGEITLTASDDGLNASGGADGSGFGAHRDTFASSEGVYITISGGTIYVKASGDGVDSNGDLTITGGQTYVSGPSGSGNGSLDYNGNATITGGIFAASGAIGMAQNFGSSSTQGAMLVQTDAGAEGDKISLADADGNVLVSWQAETSYGCVIISCPELTQGNTYTLTAGDTSSQIEMSSLIYGQGNGIGGAGKGHGGGMDGNRGGMNDGNDGINDGGIDGHRRGFGNGRMH